MKTPSFSYYGGKCRIRDWLIRHYPKGAARYVEPFCGPGNVFYRVRELRNYGRWWMNDIDTKFLRAVLTVDLDSLPDYVTKADYDRLRFAADAIADVMEPRVTFGGKGYAWGYLYRIASQNTNGYRKTLAYARQLLQGVEITQSDWSTVLSGCGPDDFVYLDPPYYNTRGREPYPNIDHTALLTTLQSAPFRWALSGYRCELYDNYLAAFHRSDKLRNSEVISGIHKRHKPVMESLWMNYTV